MSSPLPRSEVWPTRRALLRGGLGLGAATLALAGCEQNAKWHAMNVSGSTPALEFAMTRVGDGKPVTAADYRGKIVMLYLGYTNCPDVCPTTLANLASVLRRLGPDANDVRMLFVTVDPNRDTPQVLKEYVENFVRQIDGLRGTADQLEALARRYRLVYSVEPETKDHPYEVTHSSAVYVFDGSGAARLLVASLSTTTPDIAGTAADLKRLVEAGSPTGFFARLLRLV
jgi:protein SCO1/2